MTVSEITKEQTRVKRLAQAKKTQASVIELEIEELTDRKEQAAKHLASFRRHASSLQPHEGVDEFYLPHYPLDNPAHYIHVREFDTYGAVLIDGEELPIPVANPIEGIQVAIEHLTEKYSAAVKLLESEIVERQKLLQGVENELSGLKAKSAKLTKELQQAEEDAAEEEGHDPFGEDD